MCRGRQGAPDTGTKGEPVQDHPGGEENHTRRVTYVKKFGLHPKRNGKAFEVFQAGQPRKICF